MRTTFLILALTLVFLPAFSQISLVGNWRRSDPVTTSRDTTNKKLNWGDIQFRADSTFLIQGDSSTNNSTTPGWHVGDELVGTWELSNNNLLTLWIEPKEHKIFLMYVIIKLSKNQLVLRSQLDRKNKKSDIKYFR